MIPLEQAATIPGWMTFAELTWLRRTALAMPPRSRVVELGCWKGRATAAVAVPHVQLFSVDNFRGGDNTTRRLAARENVKAAFLSNVRKFGLPVTLIAMDTRKAARLFPDGSVDWLFSDADHERFRQELSRWLPKVKPGGVVSGHDYGTIKFPNIARTLRGLGVRFAVAPGTSIWFFMKR